MKLEEFQALSKKAEQARAELARAEGGRLRVLDEIAALLGGCKDEDLAREHLTKLKQEQTELQTKRDQAFIKFKKKWEEVFNG